LHLLLEALPSILSARPDTRLLLVGGGPEEKRLKDLAAQLGLNDTVVFTGRVPHDQIQRYYALVDVLIYPRIALRLTEKVTPLKPLEAMALGKVVIASDVGGHRELIRDGVTGNLFRANDRDDLVRSVLRVLDNRSEWPRQVEAGHHFVEHERTWRLSVARYEPVYQRLVERRTSSNKAI
jgi:glycosyltransferase involved in cell wall biosynthesis